MAIIVYNIILSLFRAGIFVASWFNPKARKWREGRKGIMDWLKKTIPADAKIIWVHCASLGEFEQGRPVMEELRKKFPGYRILLSFFSPSGYEAQKDYSGADWVIYLPLDGPGTARRFLDLTHPSLVIFVKYEFWYYYLKKIKYRKIPLLLISALFRKDMSFFKWYGGLQQKMLARFDQLFVQNQSSLDLLKNIGLGNISAISGDTRFDRVTQIAGAKSSLPLIEEFLGDNHCIVAGSTWPEDEEILVKAWQGMDIKKWKWIIAPHEISQKYVLKLKNQFSGAILYSELIKDPFEKAGVLIIDNIGMLSLLYQYGQIAYVGGGFIKMGVHNVLEPAAYSKPVFIGPFYQKYQEAIGLVDAGGAIVTETAEQFNGKLMELIYNETRYAAVASAAGNYVKMHAGATGKICSYIQEKRLLTS